MLGLHKLTANISSKYKIAYDFDSIFSRLIYSRIIFPASKLSTFSESKKFLEQPDFQLQHVYRALDIIAKEDSYLQSELYKNSCTLSKRNDSILFYDCTNFFFESESQSGIRQYGCSKEHRPSPIVEMGLFMDGDGIPLAFSIFEGNKNEQQSLIPLEQQIIKILLTPNLLFARMQVFLLFKTAALTTKLIVHLLLLNPLKNSNLI